MMLTLMIVCICNNLTEKDIAADASLIVLVGNCCGKCVEKEFVEAEQRTDGRGFDSRQVHQKYVGKA